MSETADALLAAALRRVPWAPAGLASTGDSAIARAEALLSWARTNPGQEAEAIVDALRPALLQLGDSGEASGLPELRALLALIP